MYWWRLKDFFKRWAHFFASGESSWSWVRKVLGALVFLGILRFTAWDIPVLIAIQNSPPLINVRLGLLIFIIAAIAWALISAGRAYELAGVPDLSVATKLEEDRDIFRLFLVSKQKDFETTVRLMEVFNADGTRYLPGRFPIPLDWTHHSGESLIHLTEGVPESVSVARINRSPTGRVGMLFYTGATHLDAIQIATGESSYFCLRIDRATRKPIERWFRFERIDDTEIMAFPVTLPPFKPQAIL